MRSTSATRMFRSMSRTRSSRAAAVSSHSWYGVTSSPRAGTSWPDASARTAPSACSTSSFTTRCAQSPWCESMRSGRRTLEFFAESKGRAMAQVSYVNATCIYAKNPVPAVNELNLEIADGEFMVLVGPSGSGKSTALRMLAGLEPVSGGTVQIGGEDVSDKAPKDRDIAMVFQNYALYPHMSVAENTGIGLKLRRTPKQDVNVKVLEVAETLGLERLLERKPAQLSGGQRQRVAIGRAMVREPQA